MLINSIKNYSDDYGYARASATQESNWRIAGDLAGTYLPILMSVLKGLVYSSFIFMLPMLIMSGGWGRYLGYLTLVASFQLWAPLNAVLNMFIDIYSSTTLKAISDQIVSFSTMSRIGNYTDKIVAVASGLQLAIPFLAFSIIQGGVGGFIHLAGTITGASQSAASQAANESVTNNKSFDNYSVGNRQLYSQGGFKTDWNESYAAGASSYQHTDGTMEKVTGGGNTLFQSGVGLTMSGGSTKVAAREGVSTQLHQAFSENQSMLASDQRSYSDTLRSAETTSADYIKRIAAAESEGKKIDYSTLGDKAEEVREAVSQTRHMNQNYLYGHGQDLGAGGKIGVGGSAGFSGGGARGNGVSANVSADVGGDIRLTNTSSQSVTDESQIGRDKNVSINYSNLAKALSSEEFAKTNSLDTSYSEDLRKNFEKQQSLEQSIGMRQEQAAHYSNAISHMHSKDSSWEQDKYHELESKVSKAYGVSTKDAHSMIENNDPRVVSIRRSMDNIPTNDTLSQVNRGKESVSGERALQSLNSFSVQNQKSINTDPTKGVKERAENSGLKTHAKHLDSGGLEQKVNTIIQGNQEKIAEARSEHGLQETIRQQKINTLEKNRIGQGKYAKFFGVGGETNPSTIDPADGKSTITEISKVDKGSIQKAGQIVDKKK
ncbi:Conjugal transfer protein TraG C-terminal domain protein (plasmid) [Candidatus Trichorickettsia mobilis]|nr:Conjugal transfer protein TraG C-terminal domain protein [Candidatus Trichorickettsia mobilis]